jgi:hypothetical protein
MAHYKVHETYTPDDTNKDRTRRDAEFTSDSNDLTELAIQARIACEKAHPFELVRIRRLVQESADQLEGQATDDFEITLFSNNGEWYLEVEQV